MAEGEPMTKDEIMQLEGRELDTEVTRRVFMRSDFYLRTFVQPYYSSDISAAWMVVEKMMKLGYRYVLRGNFEGNGLHWCGFDQQEWADLNPLWQCKPCKSLPVAICRAALLAMEDSDE